MTRASIPFPAAVIICSTDFTKAFDTVDHAILLSILVNYNVSPPVVNWILSFLTGRSQVCKVIDSFLPPVLLIKASSKVLVLGPSSTLL